jgi:hypothetical protein
VHSFEGRAFAFLVKPVTILANLTVKFLDVSLVALSGTTIKMSDNGRAFFRAEPYDLLA